MKRVRVYRSCGLMKEVDLCVLYGCVAVQTHQAVREQPVDRDAQKD